VKETKETAPASETEATPGKLKRRWKYVGQSFNTGIYLPDLITMVNPITLPDADIDAFVARWPKLRDRVWKEV
jgi:hypothetical protein